MKRNPIAAVCIHGAGGGGWEWAIWQRVLATRGWSVLAPDLMPAASGIVATRFVDYAAQARAWCARIERPLVLIGASLGGLLALAVSAHVAPAALVLINPMPPAGAQPHAASRDYPDLVAWGRERSLARTRRAMPDADEAACLFAMRRWRDESGAVLRAAAQGIQVETPGCPILVLASELDDDVPIGTSRATATRLGAELRIVPGASHVGPLLGRSAAVSAAQAADWHELAVRARV